MPLAYSTPLYKQIEANLKPLFSKRIPRDVFGKSPSSIFIGKYNYPNVFAGPMVGLTENIANADSPGEWYGLSLQKIIEHRLSLARGEKTVNVKATDSRISLDLMDTALSMKPIDVEVRFEKEPFQRINFSTYLQPMGASGKMEKFSLADNPSIPKKVLSLVEEKLNVRTVVEEGFEYFSDVYYLQRVLSSGALGKIKKLVPTRWSITAADSILANNLLEDVREYRSVDKIAVYSNVWMGNHFEIAVLPGTWEFEQFESWEPNSYWADNGGQLEYEYEPFQGRSDYAAREGGGYYSSRLSCVQALHKMKRQGKVAVFREISDEYQMPLGVWVVREVVNSALKNKPTYFENRLEMLNYLKTKLKRPLAQYLSKSRVLTQRKLVDYQ
ncbi:MAG: hypothetical protein V1644_00345 [Candidatus Micrarchaeota archaeon]